MSVQAPHHQLEIPPRMRVKLEAFRRRVCMIKLAEGVLAAAFGLMVSYLLVFASDRMWETPAALRALILVTGAMGLGVWLPLNWYRWVWCTRKLEAVARLLRHKFPRLGDQLLGIVELVRSELEQERSETLCRAAMKQVDERASERDFSDAVPSPRLRQWAQVAGVASVFVVAASVAAPAAAANALARWLMPWKPIERYTFAQLDGLPNTLVVPYAEPFSVDVSLSDSTDWSPGQASARYGDQQPIHADLKHGGYRFTFSPQKDSDRLQVSVGDADQSIMVEPTTRPELASITARVRLPDYLKYSRELTRDVRGGSVSLVKGSRAVFEATATRELAAAAIDGTAQQTAGKTLVSSPVEVNASTTREFTWNDSLGLTAKESFTLSITAHDDEQPSIWCSELPPEQVVLDDEVLSFQVQAEDDFGVMSVGMEWEGVEDPIRNPHPARGERIISAGGPQQRQLKLDASFSAKRESIHPQTLLVRLFAVDYFPGRERVYSPTCRLHVLSPEEHAIWLTHQLRKWFRQAQDVYERELQLHATNKAIRELSPEEIDRSENRRRIETQAAAETANARRLGGLTADGDKLIQQAARNEQFNVATLESLADLLQTLKDIADNRMPSVADLLKQAAHAATDSVQSPPGQAKPAASSGQENPPQVGLNRDGRSGGDRSQPQQPSNTPSIVDVESGFNELDDDQQQDDQQQQDPSQPGSGGLTLPATVVQGGGPERPKQDPSCPAVQKISEAVQEQDELLAQFAKVADELQRILNNLEGSTFVKRLKAASRRQLELAAELNENLLGSFGVDPENLDERFQRHGAELAEREIAQSDNVYVIQEDLQAYFNRVQLGKFRTVLNEMRSTEVVGKLRDVAVTMNDNLNGQSVAHTEFWADTLDRWAEQLVGPG